MGLYGLRLVSLLMIFLIAWLLFGRQWLMGLLTELSLLVKQLAKHLLSTKILMKATKKRALLVEPPVDPQDIEAGV